MSRRTPNPPGARVLSTEDWAARLDRLCRQLLGMSGEDFVADVQSGHPPLHQSTPDLAAMIPFATRFLLVEEERESLRGERDRLLQSLAGVRADLATMIEVHDEVVAERDRLARRVDELLAERGR